MRQGGFDLALVDGHVEPGIWTMKVDVGGEHVLVPVDLIVPEAAATGGGRRGARLGPHGRRAARRVTGLEATLVDHARMTIASLEPRDSRSMSARVAGPAALLVAKGHKIHDRLVSGRADRLVDKDAADVFRLMQSTVPETVGSTPAELAQHPMAGAVSAAAVGYLEQQFARRGRPGVEMAIRAMRLAVPAERIETICVAYTSALLDVARAASGTDYPPVRGRFRSTAAREERARLRRQHVRNARRTAPPRRARKLELGVGMDESVRGARGPPVRTSHRTTRRGRSGRCVRRRWDPRREARRCTRR